LTSPTGRTRSSSGPSAAAASPSTHDASLDRQDGNDDSSSDDDESYDDAIASLISTTNDLTGQLTLRQLELSELSARNNALQHENSELHAEIGKLRDKLATDTSHLLSRVSSLESTIRTLELQSADESKRSFAAFFQLVALASTTSSYLLPLLQHLAPRGFDISTLPSSSSSQR
jgi:FtsZ-binding cell division protein ZapB